MTIKEIMKKIEATNDIHEAMGMGKVALYIEDINPKYSNIRSGICSDSYKGIMHELKSTYADWAFDAIKACDYELGKEVTLNVTDKFGVSYPMILCAFITLM